MAAVASAIAEGLRCVSYGARWVSTNAWRVADAVEDTTEREWRALGLILLAALLASLEPTKTR
jgi:uncharacterized protein involved in cysteine biosynthesis